MNPYLLLVIGLALAGAYFGGEHQGHAAGVNDQKVTDQATFDRYNREIDRNKTEAASLLATANAKIVAGQAREDEFKTQLEKAREINRNEVDTLRRKYASTGLRFAAPAAAGCGDGRGGSSGPETKTAGAEGPLVVVQLPDKITGDLRQLTVDADTLRVEYAACYAYVNRDQVTSAGSDLQTALSGNGRLD